MTDLPPVTMDPCAICGTPRRTLLYRNGKFVCANCAEGTKSAGQEGSDRRVAAARDREAERAPHPADMGLRRWFEEFTEGLR